MAQTLSKEGAVDVAIRDAAARTQVPTGNVSVESADDATFPNAALGAPREGEMSFDMMTSGWAIRVTAAGQRFEYRANPRQVRLAGADGRNHIIFPA